MPYIGNEVGNRFVASKAASVYSGNGSTTAFTLEHAVGSDEDILVSVDGVIQEPSVAYAVSSGTTLTFTAAPSSNSGNNIFVYYLFRTVATVDHPSTSALTATSGTFTAGITGTLQTAAQTNITSVGTLTSFRSTGIDDNADALAMTISSDEDVMFGTTTNNPYTSNVNGVSIRGGNTSMQISKDGQVGLLINRKTSDGQIIQFAKDATAVGSIGYSSATNIAINNANSKGLGIGSGSIFPTNGSTGISDAGLDLGYASSRFKDLYLSSGVFLGGTGSSNLLNDYEEGTWTPTIGGTSNSNEPAYGDKHGTYTKIGRMVTVHVNITITAVNSLNGTILFKGLPFTIGDNLNSTSVEASGSFSYVQGMSSAISTIETAANHSQTYFTAYIGSGTSWTTKAALAHSDLANNFGCRATLTYFL